MTTDQNLSKKRSLMNNAIIIGLSLSGIFLLVQIYMAYFSNNTSSQPYRVIKKDDNIEIRFYPSATLAYITAEDKTYDKLGNNGFRKLANYIFGSNKRKEKIAMTSPVYMQINPESSRMSFVLPSQYNAINSPMPNDSSINIETTDNQYVATLEFGGFMSEKKIADHILELREYLLNKGISFDSKESVLGYNPPYQVINRRNEILIRIDYHENSSN